MIRRLFAMLLFAGFMSAAFASSCPVFIGDIDAALEDPAVADRLGEVQMTEVRRLRDKGAEAHKSGDHAQSMEALRSAKELLGIS